MNAIVDKDSVAYAFGFDHALADRDYRNPCGGNPRGTDNYYFGFKAGETARANGCANRAEYEARETAKLAESQALTIETAKAYLVEKHAGALLDFLSAAHAELDGAPVVQVEFRQPGADRIEGADIWLETRADGSTFIYGEW